MQQCVGYEQHKDKIYSWKGQKRGTSPFLVIQHSVLGKGRLDFADTRNRLGPGQTMLVTVPQAHRYGLERGKHGEYFWLVLSSGKALRLAGENLTASGPVLDSGPALVAIVVARADAGPCFDGRLCRSSGNA